MNPQSQSYGQGSLQQAASNQAAYLQAMQGAYALPKEDPKNAFLERVRKIYVKRIELRIRLTMGIGGLIMFMVGPVIGFQVFRFWSWVGFPSPIREIGGTILGVGVVVLAIVSFVMSLDGGVAQRWARDWVDEQEGK